MIAPSKFDSIKDPRRYRVREATDGAAVYDSISGEVVRLYTQRNNAQRGAKSLNDWLDKRNQKPQS